MAWLIKSKVRTNKYLVKRKKKRNQLIRREKMLEARKNIIKRRNFGKKSLTKKLKKRDLKNGSREEIRKKVNFNWLKRNIIKTL